MLIQFNVIVQSKIGVEYDLLINTLEHIVIINVMKIIEALLEKFVSLCNYYSQLISLVINFSRKRKKKWR